MTHLLTFCSALSMPDIFNNWKIKNNAMWDSHETCESLSIKFKAHYIDCIRSFQKPEIEKVYLFLGKKGCCLVGRSLKLI